MVASCFLCLIWYCLERKEVKMKETEIVVNSDFEVDSQFEIKEPALIKAILTQLERKKREIQALRNSDLIIVPSNFVYNTIDSAYPDLSIKTKVMLRFYILFNGKYIAFCFHIFW